jgi:hypothetical protein
LGSTWLGLRREGALEVVRSIKGSARLPLQAISIPFAGFIDMAPG